MTDSDEEIGKLAAKTADDLLLSQNKIADGIAARLREALAGLNRHEVLAAAEISERTLNRILAGESTKHGTLIALAHATGVERQWLIHGTGQKRQYQPGDTTAEGHEVVEGPVMLFGNPPFQPHFARPEAPVLNAGRMATALAAARQLFDAENRRPSDEQLVKAMLLIYNHLTELQAQIDAEDATRASKE